jgi:uncharacterized protein
MKYLKWFLRSLLWSLSIMVLLLVGCQSKIIYHPRAYTEQERVPGAQRIMFQTSEGLQVAHHCKATAASSPRVWIICGGNGSLALDYAGQLADWGNEAHFIFVDYPGYGDCEGSPSPKNIRATMRALRGEVCQRLQLTPEELGKRSAVFGHSLGCAAALIAAEEWSANKAVLVAPFTTMTEMARKLLGAPLCYLNHHRFDNFQTLASLKSRGGKAIILHGDADEVIPVAMGQELHSRFPETVELHVIEGGRHNDIIYKARDSIAKAVESMSE